MTVEHSSEEQGEYSLAPPRAFYCVISTALRYAHVRGHTRHTHLCRGSLKDSDSVGLERLLRPFTSIAECLSPVLSLHALGLQGRADRLAKVPV